MVVFDMAGTTVWDEDNAVARGVCAAVRAAGVDVAEADVDPVRGMPKPLAIAALLERGRGVEPDEREVAGIHADFQRRIIEHYRTAPEVREIDEATEVFRALKGRGIRVTLDTGFDRSIIDTIVRRLGWGPDVLDGTIGSDEVLNGRPAPDMIHALMQRAGITDPTCVAKIGDSVSDIEEGLAAQCGLVAAVLCHRTRPAMDRFPGVRGVASLRAFLDLVLKAEKAGT